MTDFYRDIKEKKSIAYSARNRKCGSKSKKCSLPSDRMTNKQWKERCGEIMTYQFKPMTWEDFKVMPADLQQLYLDILQDKFSVTGGKLTEMLGTTMMTFRKYCNANNLQPGFKCGRRMTPEEETAFNAFAKWETHGEEEIVSEYTTEESSECYAETTEEVNLDAGTDNKAQVSTMAMTSFHLSFAGNFSRDMLANSMSYIVPKGTKVRVDIRCEILE